MLHGIDIASYQSKLIRSNPQWITGYNDFVIIKATEGTNYHYHEGDEFIEKCRKSGIPYGVYHYARAEKNEPVNEAMYFLSHCNKNRDALYALDVEGEALKHPDIDTWSRTWMDTVYRATGKRPLLYTSLSEVHKFQKVCEGNYGLWIAQWGTPRVGNISPWKFWAIWQYHVNKELNLDMNLFNGNLEQFKRYCNN